MSVSRFGVSLEAELLAALDSYVVENRFPNRSRAVRQLIEKYLVEKKWQCNHKVAGAVTLVYRHRQRELIKKIADLKRDYFKEIMAVQQFHLSLETDMEIIAVKGQAYRLTELADKLISLKGMQHGKLVMTHSDEKAS